MTRDPSLPISDDRGWLITPRALTSVATIVGLAYTLHAPVRYVLHVGATVDALTERVASLETEVDQQRGAIVAAQLAMPGRGTAPSGPALNASTAVRSVGRAPRAPRAIP